MNWTRFTRLCQIITMIASTIITNLKLEELWEIDGDAEHEEKGATDREVWTDLQIFLFYFYQTFVFCLCKILICCPICCFWLKKKFKLIQSRFFSFHQMCLNALKEICFSFLFINLFYTKTFLRRGIILQLLKGNMSFNLKAIYIWD